MRKRLLLLAVIALWSRSHTALAATPFPDDCADVCSSDGDCFMPCFATDSDFYNDILSDCEEYGVCGYEPYCGDGNCDNRDSPFYYETPSSCPADCGGGCTPDWAVDSYDTYAIGATYDERCVPVDSAVYSGPSADETEDLYYCYCTLQANDILTSFDSNYCETPNYMYSCSTDDVGYFEDYSDYSSGFCCAAAEAGPCWGTLSCPY
jgi:hypothetical protein